MDPLEELRASLGGDTGKVAQQLRRGGEHWDDGTLRRWLIAKKNDVRETRAQLEEHALWRAQFVPNGRIGKAEVQDRLNEKTVYLQGTDQNGRPVVYIIGSNIQFRLFSNNESVKRFLCFVLDAAIQSMPAEQRSTGKITVVFDLTDFGMRNADPHILPVMFALLEQHYPERLAHAIIYNAPTVFYGLWSAAQPFMDPVTKTKILFLDGEDGKKEVVNLTGPEVLPQQMGGSAKLVPVDQAWEKLMALA